MEGSELKQQNVQGKPKKAGTLVSAYIEETAYQALLKHCEATGQSKTKAIERAIMSYCKASEAKP